MFLGEQFAVQAEPRPGKERVSFGTAADGVARSLTMPCDRHKEPLENADANYVLT